MKIHVTGGAGFIGSRLVRYLVDAGHDVTVFDNVSRGSVDKLGSELDEIEFIPPCGDKRDEKFLRASCRGHGGQYCRCTERCTRC
jgi:nucleoside-diphosphate-sugar epimerase